MPRVIHFEINCDDPERAVKFYTRVFDWKIDKWEGPMDYWLITTGPDNLPGINGAIMKRQDPSAQTINTVDVPSVDDFIAKIKKAGGKALTEKMPIPGIGYFAYCQDTEGNTFGIMHPDMSAK